MIRFVFCLVVMILPSSLLFGESVFELTINDPDNQFLALHDDLESNLLAAAELWAEVLGGDGTISIHLDFDPAITRGGGRSFTSGLVENRGGFRVFEQGWATELRTGVDPNGVSPDVQILLEPGYLRNELWFDPDPVARTALVPRNRTDAVTVFLHELGHAIGFNGWIDGTTGEFSGNFKSTFDEQISFDGDNLFFNGSAATALYGQPPAITFGNPAHIANASPRPGEDLVEDLMNGVVFDRGRRYNISPLDLAILHDTGVPIDTAVGDTDWDGDVDTNDRTSLTLNWTGSTIGGLDKQLWEGDFDGDGDVDSNDVTLLVVGWTGAQASSPATSGVVPEPHSPLLFVMGSLVIWLTVVRRVRRANHG